MRTWIFYFEDDNAFSFEIKAYNYNHAYNVAYNYHGPQVEDMMYKEKI